MEVLLLSTALAYVSIFLIGVYILFSTQYLSYTEGSKSIPFILFFLLLPGISWVIVYLLNKRKHFQDNVKKIVANSTPVLEDNIKLILPTFKKGVSIEDLKLMPEIEAHLLYESLKDECYCCTDLSLILSILNGITEVDKVIFKVRMLERLAFYREKKRNISEIYTNRPDMIAFLTKPCDSEPFAPLLKHLKSIENPTSEDLSSIAAISKQLESLKRKRDADNDYYDSY